ELIGAERVGGREQPEVGQGVAILWSLGKVDRLLAPDDVTQPVDNPFGNSVQIPYPLARFCWIGTPNAESLRVEAYLLEQQIVGFVAKVVSTLDLPLGLRFGNGCRIARRH